MQTCNFETPISKAITENVMLGFVEKVQSQLKSANELPLNHHEPMKENRYQEAPPYTFVSANLSNILW